MLGYVIGTACLVGLAVLSRRRRRYWGYYAHAHGCGYDAGYQSHRHGWGPRGMLRWFFARLDTSPSQEKVVLEAFDDLKAAGRGAREEVARSRTDVAEALRAAPMDEAILAHVFARHDETMAAFRKAAVAAVTKVHDALDDRQRGVLADLIARGPRWSRWGAAY